MYELVSFRVWFLRFEVSRVCLSVTNDLFIHIPPPQRQGNLCHGSSFYYIKTGTREDIPCQSDRIKDP